MTNLNVANEIYRQLGGRKFSMMTGAKNLQGDTDSLSFRLPRAKDGINHVKITLTPLDVYDIEFSRVTCGHEFKVFPKGRFEGIYCDGMTELFERTTGLCTSLF